MDYFSSSTLVELLLPLVFSVWKYIPVQLLCLHQRRPCEDCFKICQRCSHLLPCWNRTSSSAVLSRTVTDTTVIGTWPPWGNTPATRTSCQSEWILQMSTESKYLPGTDTNRPSASSSGVIYDQRNDLDVYQPSAHTCNTNVLRFCEPSVYF